MSYKHVVCMAVILCVVTSIVTARTPMALARVPVTSGRPVSPCASAQLVVIGAAKVIHSMQQRQSPVSPVVAPVSPVNPMVCVLAQ